MKKNKILIIFGVAALCLIGLIVFIISSNNKNTNNQTPVSNNNSSNAEVSNSYKSACDVFTLEIAKKYLGENAAIGNTKASDSTEGDNSINSSCLYDAGEDSLESRNIMLITAKNSTGQDWNKSEFENSPNELAKLTEDEPPKLTQIDNLGEKAYWNPQTGTLHVIISDGKYWLSVQGSIKDETKEIEEHKNMATDIINNL